MKTTKKDFARFKKEFLRWVDIFGLKGYRIVFYHNQLKGNYAQIHTDEEGMLAEPAFTILIDKTSLAGYKTPELHGKHEAIHLLLHRLLYLGTCRYVREDEIYQEWEKLVRILEKVL